MVERGRIEGLHGGQKRGLSSGKSKINSFSPKSDSKRSQMNGISVVWVETRDGHKRKQRRGRGGELVMP